MAVVMAKVSIGFLLCGGVDLARGRMELCSYLVCVDGPSGLVRLEQVADCAG
jgi:hypothetical protein